MVAIFIHYQTVLLELMSWKWRAPYPITPEQKHPVPLSDLKIHLYYMLTTYVSKCDASSNLVWAFFVFPFLSLLFTKRFAMSSGISKWTGERCGGGGRGSTVCAFDYLKTDIWQICKPSFYWSTLGKLFSCVPTAIIVVIIKLVVLKVHVSYPESLRSSGTLCLHGTKSKRDQTFPAKSPFSSI